MHGGDLLCSACHLTVVAKRGDVCASCNPLPSKKSKDKEKRIAAFLQDPENELIPFTRWNKTIPDAQLCGKYRPDFVWELSMMQKMFGFGFSEEEEGGGGDPCFAVILEVDEHQHKYRSYSLGCELKRMGEIVQSFNGLPVHFKRFNPDSFKLKSLKVRRANYLQYHRLGILRERLKDTFNDPNFADNLITIEYLFYDNEEESEIIQTHKFKTLEDYVLWMNKLIEEDETRQKQATKQTSVAT